MSFLLHNDPASGHQRLIRPDHISAVETNRHDQTITLLLVGGQELRLTHEESKQFLHHTKGKLHSGGEA
jgi:hypothetical protein